MFALEVYGKCSPPSESLSVSLYRTFLSTPAFQASTEKIREYPDSYSTPQSAFSSCNSFLSGGRRGKALYFLLELSFRIFRKDKIYSCLLLSPFSSSFFDSFFKSYLNTSTIFVSAIDSHVQSDKVPFMPSVR